MREMISSRARYALRALLDLSQRHPGSPVLVTDIANRRAIPLNFLHQILLDLKQAGLVASRKGPGGGFSLAKNPEDVTLAEILGAIEGPSLSLACQGPQQDCACPHPEVCAIRLALEKVSAEMDQSLRATTLANLRDDQEEMEVVINVL